MTTTTRAVRSDRLNALPPYLFVDIDRKRRARIAAGADVINLGVGDPDRPTPNFIIESMSRAMHEPWTHQYAPSEGTKRFRHAAARFMERRFGVKADPDKHIISCIGSKEGIGHLPLALLNQGDAVLVPEVAYPVYVSGAVFAGAGVVYVPTGAATKWRPDFESISPRDAERARLLWINFPNNPTAACVGVDYFADVISFAERHGIVIGSDLAYSELYFERAPVSIWQSPAADLNKTLAVEFHSLSKTFNMTGWRIGFAVGHPEVVSALNAVKGNYDSGAFAAIQEAGAEAMDNYEHKDVAGMRDVYRERRDTIIPALQAMGCEVRPPEAGFFVWARCPQGKASNGGSGPVESMAFASRCLEEADVVVVPGAGFGQSAKHFFRIALTVEAPRLKVAGQRLAKMAW